MKIFTFVRRQMVPLVVLCCFVFFGSQSAQAQYNKLDPGNNNPPPAGPILDLSGTAIPTSAYQQYSVSFTAGVSNTAITFAFREDPAFILLANVSVTDVTIPSSPSGNLLVNGDFSGTLITSNGNTSAPFGWTYANQYGATFGGVVVRNCGIGGGSCWDDGAVQAYDAISQTIATTIGDIYQITFFVRDTGPSGVFSDVSTNGDTTDTAGNGRNLTVYAQAGLPPAQGTVTQPGQPLNPNNAANLAQSFVFNAAPVGSGQHVEFDFDYTTAFNTPDPLTIVANTTPEISDDSVTQPNYQSMVNGTALAETTCFTSLGQLDGTGAAACPKLTIKCTNANSSVFAGDNCPQSTARNLYFKHVIDVVGGTPVIPLGSAPTLAMGSDNWAPGSCVLVGPEEGQLCPKSEGTQFFDCCRIGGTPPKTNSGFIAGCCEREWTTTPTIALWSNNPTVPVSFTSNPPSVPVPNPNHWVAAPGQSVTFGFEAPGAAPDPTFPIHGDQTLLNPTPPSTDASAPCGSSTTHLNWGTPGTNPPGFNTSGSVTVPGEGAYELHFFSTDCDDMQELIYANPSDPNKNWAKFKTALFNVDTTKPTVTGLTLSPTTQIPGQNITANYNCADNLSNVVNSGLASCGKNLSLGGALGPLALNEAFTVAAGLNGPQTYSVTATDRAGNTFTANANYFAGYQFFGFFAPVSNPGTGIQPVINTIKAGRTVPVKWQVLDGNGVAVTGLTLGLSNGGVASGTVHLTAVNSTVCAHDTVDNSILVDAAGNSGLQDLGGGNYQFNWKTVLPSGACVLLSVDPGDGTQHQAYFYAK
jgi:hypothetical protein